MGFEYKIKLNLTKLQKDEIEIMIKNNFLFYESYIFDNKESFEFRHELNKGKLPNFIIIFEVDGIYICKFDTSCLWKDIDYLKEYLVKENISFQVIDYDD